jgi:Tfp pilus assembly protein PilX
MNAAIDRVRPPVPPELRSSDERGGAMVLALGLLVVLAMLAIVIVAVATNEKKTSSSEYAYDRAFYSSDAALEAGVNWLRTNTSPPAAIDSLNNVRLSPTIDLSGDIHYTFNVQYRTKQFRPGWSTEYKDYVYRVQTTGSSVRQSQAAVDANVTRLYREGY